MLRFAAGSMMESEDTARSDCTEPAEGPRFRAHARRRVRLAATLIHAEAGWEADLGVLNLGLGGACVELPERLSESRVTAAKGDSVRLAFITPDRWDPLVVPARVAWWVPPRPHVPGRAGLAFEYDSPESAMGVFQLLGGAAIED